MPKPVDEANSEKPRSERPHQHASGRHSLSLTSSLSMRSPKRRSEPWPLLCAIGAVASTVLYWGLSSRESGAPTTSAAASAPEQRRFQGAAPTSVRDLDLGANKLALPSAGEPAPRSTPSASPARVTSPSAAAAVIADAGAIPSAAERPRASQAVRPRPPAAARPPAAPLHEQDIGF